MEQFNSLPVMKNGKRAMSSQAVAWVIATVSALLIIIPLVIIIDFLSMFLSTRSVPNPYYDYDNSYEGMSYSVPESCQSSDYGDYIHIRFMDVGEWSHAYMSIFYHPDDKQIQSADDQHALAKEMAESYSTDYVSDVKHEYYNGRDTYNFSFSTPTEYSLNYTHKYRMFNYKNGVMYLELFAPSGSISYYDSIYKDFVDSITFDEE